jgi:hypothetical protein
MECQRCGHANVSSFRFCEVCLSPLSGQEGGTGDVVGRFFDEADLLEASPINASRGTAAPQRFELPWIGADTRLGLLGREAEVSRVATLVEGAIERSVGSYLLVRGEVGSGRSTLIASVCGRVRERKADARFLITSAQGCHRPYALIERLLRLRFDIPDYLGGTIAGERFERAGEALFGDATGAEVARTCGPMLGFHFWNEHDIDFEDPRRASSSSTTPASRTPRASPSSPSCAAI